MRSWLKNCIAAPIHIGGQKSGVLAMAEINQANATAAFSNISPFTGQQSPIGAQRVQEQRNYDDRASGVQRTEERSRTSAAGEQPPTVVRAAADEEDDSVAQSQFSAETRTGFQRGAVLDIFV
jgi:hypothetical protein